MSSLCLLSVDDVYEQDGLAAECLMVHKIKPRLSAAQRLPSGSHVVEACWEYKFRAHGQVNAPPPPPRALPPPSAPSPGARQGHPRPAAGALAACVSRYPNRFAGQGQPGPGSPSSPTPAPPQSWASGSHAPWDPVLPLGLPSQPRELAAPLRPSFLLVSLCFCP